VDATAHLGRAEPLRWIGVLLRRSWIGVLVTVLFVAAAWMYLKKVPKVYEAKGSVYVSSRPARMLESGVVSPEDMRDLEQMRSIEQGLMSSTLLMRVIEAGKLAEQPDFAPGAEGSQDLLKVMSKRVRAELRRGTRLIDIAVEDTDPGRAQRLVGLLVTEYEKWNAERQGELVRQVSGDMTREEETLRQRMERSERALQAFREAHPIPGVAGKSGPSIEDLGRIESELTKTKAERMRLEAEAEAFRKFDPQRPEAIAALTGNPNAAGVLSLVRAVQDKEVEFATIKERYGFKHPVHIEASNELAALKKSLADAARSAGEAVQKSFQIASENEAKLTREVETARATAVSSEGLRAQFEVLEREALADRTTHEAVAARLRETALAGVVAGGVLRWEDLPLVPDKAIKPRKAVWLGLAGVAGMFAGLCLMVGSELADGRVRDAGTVSRITRAPLLATVEATGSSDPVLISQPGSKTAEAFRQLRPALSPPQGHGGSMTVMFVSASQGEGRSFCALNHAAALATQGFRTLLLDADMRRPGLSRDHLQVPDRAAGLCDFLAGTVEPAQACHPTILPNLYLLSSGSPQENAGDLLAGTRFPALLEDAYRWFDRVVIDAPPVLDASDALAITRYTDQVCLVVQKNAHGRKELRRVVDRVVSSGGRLSGFVWNETPASPSSPDGPSLPVTRPYLSAPASSSIPVAKLQHPPRV
jgi:succinoglycan biosynthesis transport protein ExoP